MRKKTIPAPETTPVSRRTRGSIKRTASLGDISHFEADPSQKILSGITDKTLVGFKAQLKKRKEDLSVDQ